MPRPASDPNPSGERGTSNFRGFVQQSPFVLSFIANIARKRLELNRDKTSHYLHYLVLRHDAISWGPLR